MSPHTMSLCRLSSCRPVRQGPRFAAVTVSYIRLFLQQSSFSRSQPQRPGSGGQSPVPSRSPLSSPGPSAATAGPLSRPGGRLRHCSQPRHPKAPEATRTRTGPRSADPRAVGARPRADGALERCRDGPAAASTGTRTRDHRARTAPAPGRGAAEATSALSVIFSPPTLPPFPVSL